MPQLKIERGHPGKTARHWRDGDVVIVQLPNCMGVRYEVDKRWRDFLDNWADYNRVWVRTR